MLYCCGMRPGEPPTLLREDVDLDTGDVYVRQSKRHRDRHLVMSDDMRALCSNYDSRCPRDRRWFFERFDGAPYTTRWFGDSWLRIVRSCGIEWRGEPPRPYDLRHAFASRNVVRWMDEGLDVMCMAPTLSAYMGHSSISSTLYYVHLIPERLRATKGVDWASLAEVYGEGDVR